MSPAAGLAVLARIRKDRGRVRLDVVNDEMARAALDAAATLRDRVDAAGRVELDRLTIHISRVLDARAKRRAR